MVKRGENYNGNMFSTCHKAREAKILSKYRFDDGERLKMAELGCMRILAFKRYMQNIRLSSQLEI